MSKIVKQLSNKTQDPTKPESSGFIATRKSRVPDAKQNAGITPQTVLNALRYWWKWTIPTALLLSVVAGVAVYWFFVPKYEAIAQIRILMSAPYLAYTPDHTDGKANQQFVQTQIELLRNRLVLGPVIRQSNIRQLPELTESRDPIRSLAEQIKVAAVGKSELYRISLCSADPEAAAQTVDAVMESYFNFLTKDENENRQLMIELLEEESKRRLQNTIRLRKKLRKSAQNAGLGGNMLSPAEGNGFARHPVADLRERLTSTEVEKEVLAARIKVAEKMVSQPVNVPLSMVEERSDSDLEIQRLEQQLADLRWQRSEAARRLVRPSQNALCKQLDTAIAQTEQARNEYQIKLRERVRTEIEQRLRKQREGKIAELRTELQSREIELDLFKEAYESQFSTLQKESGESIDLQFQMAELTREEDVMEKISNRTIALRTERRAPARVFKLSGAEVPREPLESIPMKQMAAAMGGAFILPFALAVFWERLARRISATEQLRENEYPDIMGEISKLPSRRVGASGKHVNMAMQMFEESIDALRTNLILSPDIGDVRVLAVTSATNNEGKTSVATQLARSIGRANQKPILLVDGDLRCPDLHRIFRIPLGPGLAQVLSGDCELKDAVFEQADPYVHVIPAGATCENIHSLFASGKIDKFFEEAAKNYEFVIVDTPPVLAAAESLVIGAATDGMLICAMRNVSRGDQVAKVCERLSKTGVRSVGTVLSGVPCRQYAYYNGRYAQPIHSGTAK